jgi:hypothetical protein
VQPESTGKQRTKINESNKPNGARRRGAALLEQEWTVGPLPGATEEGGPGVEVVLRTKTDLETGGDRV